MTLLELLVVIAMIGILIAAVMAGMNNARVKAFDTKARACAVDIRTQQERARTTNQAFEPYEALGTIRSCDALTPAGGATDTRFAYAVRHPRGRETFTVTDSDLYQAGVARSGQAGCAGCSPQHACDPRQDQ